MIEVECECGRVLKTKDEYAGKKARCPDCGEVIQIPAPRKAGAKAPSSAGKGVGAAPKSSKKRPPAEDEFDDGSAEDDSFDDSEELDSPRTKSKKTVGKKSSKAKSGEPAEPSKKKKKKKKGDDDLNKNIIIGTAVVFGLAFLGLAGYGISQLSFGGGTKVEVPKEYVDFNSTNGELRCKIPKGWQTKFGGGSGGVPPHATFENGNVKIQFRSSQAGASLQMIAQAGSQDDGELSDDEKPVSKIHEFQRGKFADEMASYEEQGAPEMLKTGFGEARLSAFTASEGFSKIYGYRITILGTNNQWNIICKCSGSQWKDFQSVFRQVVESASGS